jgi:hypothetical protein
VPRGFPRDHESEPEVEIPRPVAAEDLEADRPLRPAALPQQDPDDGSYVRVEVTPETVQNVIATLDRPLSYYRELTIETIWGEGEADRSATDIQVWMDGGFTKVETFLPSRLVQHCMVGNSTVYIWYGNDKSWYQTAADDLSADLAQHMPTYEDVLALDKSAITETGYEILDGMSCIYVEVAEDTLGYLERYWVEVQSGLLVSTETVKDGMVVYRMTSNTMEFPIPQDASFTLPDGTVLHQVSQT